MTAYACLRYRDADAALEFLRAAFGFEPEAVHRGATGRVEHAEVRAGKSLIMVGEHRGDHGPYARMLGRGWTYVAVPDVEALYARARAADAEITMELTDQPQALRARSRRQPVELRHLRAVSDAALRRCAVPPSARRDSSRSSWSASGSREHGTPRGL
jgi:uncharacterized glyoxalase superfamily protein PhnB